MLFKISVKQLQKSDIQKLFDTTASSLIETATCGRLTKETETCFFCHNCFKLISSDKKYPRISVSNGLQLDKIPSELEKLTDLEKQLIARNLLFMKIFRLATSRMHAIKDKLINVPLESPDIEKTIDKLPRNFDDSYLIPANLKRKKSMRNTHLSAYIRPQCMIDAVYKLKQLRNIHYQYVCVDNNYSLKSKCLDNNTLESENSESDSENENEDEDTENILSSVASCQSNQNENVCLIPNEPDTRIVENNSKDTISKKKSLDQKKGIDIAPGKHL